MGTATPTSTSTRPTYGGTTLTQHSHMRSPLGQGLMEDGCCMMQVLRYKEDMAEAAEAFRKAAELDPCLCQEDQLEGLIQRTRRTLDLLEKKARAAAAGTALLPAVDWLAWCADYGG